MSAPHVDRRPSARPSMFGRAFVAIALALAAFALGGRAGAQVLPSVDTRTYRPSTDPQASMILEPAATPGPGLFGFGAIGSYSFRPVALRRPGSDEVAIRPIEHVFALDATGQIGIGRRLAVGASVPLVLYQDGDTGLPKTVSEVDHTPRTALGDAALTLKGALIRNEEGGFGLSALGYVSFPTGDRASFAGDGSMTVTTRLLAEYNVAIAFLQASIGYKVRTDRHTWPAEELGGYRFADELPWTIGLGIRPGLFGIDPGNRQRLEVAAHGWLPMGPVGPFGTGEPGSAALSPAMIAVSDRIEIGHYRDTFLLVGADIGLDSAVGVPTVRGVLGIGWSPREHDMDHDGVKDDVDGCPEIPEDRDGFEDSDGCPEIDNDDDGIIDKEDRCPNVKGVESSDPAKNGCPGEEPKPAGGPDADGDGVPDGQDKCPTQAEDRDGFQDADGCPDPDNDNDGVGDKEDACPNEAGEPSTQPDRNGCPNVDRDGDTFENSVDKCPDVAETFNGIDDEDGCPDEGGKPLVTIDDKKNVRVATPIKLIGADGRDVDPASVPTLRALALELHRHQDWTLAVGIRPGTGENAQLDALNRGMGIVHVLSSLTHHDGVAETVGWDVVKNQPQAETGIAFIVQIHAKPAKPEPVKPEPAKPEPAKP